jgi:hypothetical protein
MEKGAAAERFKNRESVIIPAKNFFITCFLSLIISEQPENTALKSCPFPGQIRPNYENNLNDSLPTWANYRINYSAFDLISNRSKL